MQIVCFSSEINRFKEAGPYYPGIPYLLSDSLVRELDESHVTNGFNYIAERKPFLADNWKHGKEINSLLVYITGKIGDTLWHTALIHQIKKHNPLTEIDVVSEHPLVWKHNKDIRSIKYEPVPMQALHSYDGYIVLDEFIASRMDAAQGNCYQLLYEEVGIPFEPEHLKSKPYLILKKEDEDSAFSSIFPPGEDGMCRASRYHLVLGLHSSSECRNLAPRQWREIAEFFAEKYKNLSGFMIYGVSDDDDTADSYHYELLQLPNYVPLHKRLGIRELAALCRLSMCVISVDSMLTHLAAAVDAPCVSLMSTVPPKQRTGTYPLSVAVWKSQSCDYAPCFYKHSTFYHRKGDLITQTPCFTPARKQCEVLKSVEISDVEQAFTRATTLKNQFDDYLFHPLPL